MEETVIRNLGRRNRASYDDNSCVSKRRRGGDFELDEISSRLFDVISQLGGKSRTSLESNLENLVQAVETDFETFKDVVIDIVSKCVTYLPSKVTVYSCLVGLLNAKKYDFGAKLLAKTITKIEEYMVDNDFSYCVNLVVFLADLVNTRVVTLSSFIDLIEDFIQEALEENVPQARSDWFVFTILHCLPWIGKEMFEHRKDVLENILDAIEGYIAKRNLGYLEILRVWESERYVQEDYLVCLWAQITEMRSKYWIEDHITRHYIAFDGQLADALQHNLPKFTCAQHSSSSVYPIPFVVLRLFDRNDIPDTGPPLPDHHSIERFIMDEEINWIILENQHDRKECASVLLDYHKKSSIPSSYIILEVIFSQLFRIPQPPIIPIFYGSLLIELCKVKSVPQVIAQAAELLYQRIDTMRLVCIDRLVDWFSYHMSNFEYRWSWHDWKDCLEMDPCSSRFIFVRELLEKCLRLSYHQRLCSVLPEEFLKIIPEKASICYDLVDEDHPFHAQAVQIESAFRNRLDPQEMVELVRSIGDLNDGDCLAVFFSVMFNRAKVSISHSMAALSKYHPVLFELIGGSKDGQMILLQTLHDIWKQKQIMIIVIATKLLRMSAVNARTIASWIFSDEMSSEFHRSWVWELLCICVHHLIKPLLQKPNSVNPREAFDEPKFEQRDHGEIDEDNDMNDNECVEAGPINKAVSAQSDLDDLLLFIIRNFLSSLSNHNSLGTSLISEENLPKTPSSDYVAGRFVSFLQRYWKYVYEIRADMEKEIIEIANIDQRVEVNYRSLVLLKD